MTLENTMTRNKHAEWGSALYGGVHVEYTRRKIKLHNFIYHNESTSYPQAEVIEIPDVIEIDKYIKRKVEKSIKTFFKYNSLFKMYIQDKEDVDKLLEYPVQQKFLGIKEPLWESNFYIKFGDLEKNVLTSVSVDYLCNSYFAYTNDGLFLRLTWKNPAKYSYNTDINAWDRKPQWIEIKPESVSEYCFYWKGLK